MLLQRTLLFRQWSVLEGWGSPSLISSNQLPSSSPHSPPGSCHLTCCVVEYVWCVVPALVRMFVSLYYTPPLPRHTTIPQGSGLQSLLCSMLRLLWGTSTDRSCGHFAWCYFGFGVAFLYFLSSVTAGKVSSLRKLWSWKSAEPYVSQMILELIQFLNCLEN